MQRVTLSEALSEEISRDERVFVIGEDIGHYGGTFDVTSGLLQRFGPMRIVSTGVSENAIVGTAFGAAIAGMRPVAEIMFCDFITYGIDQTINYAALTTYMCGGAVRVPMVIRTTTGHHGGAAHPKSLEAWFTHVPGLKVAFAATPYDAKGLLKSAIRDDNPVLLFESRHLYGVQGEVPDEEYLVPFGAADVKRAGTDLTLVTYGYMLPESLRAAETLADSGISVEVIDLRSLAPLDMDTVLGSVGRTRRLLVVHDAFRNCGLGAEVCTRVYDELFGELLQPARRLAHADVPHPYSHVLEDAVRPDCTKIVACVAQMLARPGR